MDTTDIDREDRLDMARLVAGDERALDRLMERHAAGVVRLCGNMIGNVEDARELAQEAFARVYQHRDRFRPQARFSAWLFTIAANLARNHLRWRARHPQVSLDAVADVEDRPRVDTIPSPRPTPHEAAVQTDQCRALQAALEALPANMRAALQLCVWEELSVIDAGRVLALSPKAVESLLYRARQTLRTTCAGVRS